MAYNVILWLNMRGLTHKTLLNAILCNSLLYEFWDGRMNGFEVMADKKHRPLRWQWPKLMHELTNKKILSMQYSMIMSLL